MWYVYMLLCEDKSLYTGVTTDPKRRLKEHKEGKGGAYTRSHKPEKIIYLEKCQSHNLALKREYEIKKLSREEKIKQLGLRGIFLCFI